MLGIIATTIGHESFLSYMFPPNGKNAPVLGLHSVLLVDRVHFDMGPGAIVAIYSAGCCIGNLVVGPLADKISRRWSIAFSGMFGTSIHLSGSRTTISVESVLTNPQRHLGEL